MVTHIIIPFQQRSSFQLREYAKMFEHLPEKKFSLLPMSDFMKGKKKSTEDKEAFEDRIAEEARTLKAEVNIIRNQSSFDSLLSWSCFADLVSLQVMTGKSLEQFTGVFPDGALSTMNCSLFISPFTADAFHEIMIVGDFDQSIVTAIKSFLLLFGVQVKNKKVTVFTPTPEDELSISFEQDLISFIRKSFNDVGIVPIKIEALDRQMASIANKLEKPILIIGHRNLGLLSSSELRSLIISKKLSIFYSN